MKRDALLVIVLLLTLNGCIVIEEDPIVTVSPEVVLQSHVRENNVYVTATIYANPDFVALGNIPAIFSGLVMRQGRGFWCLW